MFPSIIADNNGGAYIFWLDSKNHVSTLVSTHIDANSKLSWGKTPVNVSSASQNVLNYSIINTGFSAAYAAWQVQKKDEKLIYHQLINKKGKNIWETGGKLISNLKGNKSPKKYFLLLKKN